jgi:5-amino-6-(5-phospho-D-ribitylamino)uracil phosphatase
MEGSSHQVRRPIELVACDLDGTLLDKAGRVSERTRAAVAGVQGQGCHIVIATGRTWWESRAVIAASGMTGPGVFVGGAVVNDMLTGATLAKTTLDPVAAMEVCQAIESQGIPVMVMQDSGGHGAEYVVSAGVPIPESLRSWWEHHESDIELSNELGTKPHTGTLRISAVDVPGAIARVKESLAQSLHGKAYWHAIQVPADGVEVLEVFHPAVNKWHGLVQLSAVLKVDAGRIVAVGDDVNDLAMLKNAMLGVAMGNALSQVKSIADRVLSATNQQDGLAQLLEELVGSRMSIISGSPG